MINFLSILKLYIISLPVFLIIDGLWLGFVAKNLYANYLGYLMAPKPNWFAAGIFYLGFAFGVVIFAVSPALRESSLSKAIILGGLFGMFCYATYDLTNLATIKNWPWLITVIDIIWGTFLTALTAGISYLIAKKIY